MQSRLDLRQIAAVICSIIVACGSYSGSIWINIPALLKLFFILQIFFVLDVLGVFGHHAVVKFHVYHVETHEVRNGIKSLPIVKQNIPHPNFNFGISIGDDDEHFVKF